MLCGGLTSQSSQGAPFRLWQWCSRSIKATCPVQPGTEVNRVSCSTDSAPAAGQPAGTALKHGTGGEQHPSACLDGQQGRQAHLCTTRRWWQWCSAAIRGRTISRAASSLHRRPWLPGPNRWLASALAASYRRSMLPWAANSSFRPSMSSKTMTSRSLLAAEGALSTVWLSLLQWGRRPAHGVSKAITLPDNRRSAG